MIAEPTNYELNGPADAVQSGTERGTSPGYAGRVSMLDGTDLAEAHQRLATFEVLTLITGFPFVHVGSSPDRFIVCAYERE